MDSSAAEIIALQALTYIASDDKALHGLLASTGVDLDALKSAGNDPAILVGVLDFMLQNEPRMLEFCAAQELEPTQPRRAWSVLTGQDLL